MTTRRDVLKGTAAALTASALTATTGHAQAVDGNDNTLRALEAQWREVRATAKAAGDEYDRTGLKRAGFLCDQAWDRMFEIEREIAEAPASTADGLLIKARFYMRGLVLANPSGDDARQAASGLGDIDGVIDMCPGDLVNLPIVDGDLDDCAGWGLAQSIVRLCATGWKS